MDDHAAVSPRATVPPHGYRIGSVAAVGRDQVRDERKNSARLRDCRYSTRYSDPIAPNATIRGTHVPDVSFFFFFPGTNSIPTREN